MFVTGTFEKNPIARSRTLAVMYRLLFLMLTRGNSENPSATTELSDEGLVLETPASLSFCGGNLALINLLDSKLSFLFCLFYYYYFFDNTGKEVVRCRRKAARSQRKINSRCYGWCSITN